MPPPHAFCGKSNSERCAWAGQGGKSGSEAARSGQQGAAQALWRRTPQPGRQRAAGSARQARALQPALAAQRRSGGGAPVGRITGALGGKV